MNSEMDFVGFGCLLPIYILFDSWNILCLLVMLLALIKDFLFDLFCWVKSSIFALYTLFLEFERRDLDLGYLIWGVAYVPNMIFIILVIISYIYLVLYIL